MAVRPTYLNIGEIYDPWRTPGRASRPFPKALLAMARRCCWPMAACWPDRSMARKPISTIRPRTLWSTGPTKLYGDSNNHESWTKLPDGSILSYDVNSNPGQAQRLDPTTMTWIDSGSVPVSLEAGIGAGLNMGPGVLLADGRVLQLGRSSNTAIYTPSTTPGGTGTWTAGPVIPGGLEAGVAIPRSSGNDDFRIVNCGHVAQWPRVVWRRDTSRRWSDEILRIRSHRTASDFADRRHAPDRRLPDRFLQLQHQNGGASHRAGAAGKSCRNSKPVRLYARRRTGCRLEADRSPASLPTAIITP